MRHLVKYGAGVAAVSGAFLIFWQIYPERADDAVGHDYWVVAPTSADVRGMPSDLYEEHETIFLGMIAVPEEPLTAPDLPQVDLPDHIDVRINDSVLPPPSHA